MVITIKDAIDANMNMEQIEREVAISNSEDWVPEQKDWNKLQRLYPQEFNRKVKSILTKWALKEYSNRYGNGPVFDMKLGN